MHRRKPRWRRVWKVKPPGSAPIRLDAQHDAAEMFVAISEGPGPRVCPVKSPSARPAVVASTIKMPCSAPNGVSLRRSNNE
jgi:hypothetical protein